MCVSSALPEAAVSVCVCVRERDPGVCISEALTEAAVCVCVCDILGDVC